MISYINLGRAKYFLGRRSFEMRPERLNPPPPCGTRSTERPYRSRIAGAPAHTPIGSPRARWRSCAGGSTRTGSAGCRGHRCPAVPWG